MRKIWKLSIGSATSAGMSPTTRVILRGLMMGILAAAIAFVVSDWSKPRVVIVMGSLGAVALLVILAEQITGGARSLD
jgi:purine-cytosine permease-like protein